MYTQTQFAVNQPVLPSVIESTLFSNFGLMSYASYVFPHTHIQPPHRALPAISSTTRRRLIDALDSWHFEPHKLPDDEVLACTELLFEALYRAEGMQEAVGVSLGALKCLLLSDDR